MSISGLFFSGWEGLPRSVLVGVPAYFGLIVFLRVSGTRTLSKRNAFDLVVTVSLGSTLATILLNKQVALAEGLMVFALLVGLHYAVTWSSVRAPWVRRFVTGDPRLMLYRGQILPDALRSAHVTADKIRSAIRAAGLDHLGDVEAVVLETDGSFSVVQSGPGPGTSGLADVPRPTP